MDLLQEKVWNSQNILKEKQKYEIFLFFKKKVKDEHQLWEIQWVVKGGCKST